MDCHPERYRREERRFSRGEPVEPVPGGKLYCRTCRSYFSPHVAAHLYGEPGEPETAIKDWEQVARERYGGER